MYIYILKRKEQVFYVGTTKNYKRRFIEHYATYGDFTMDIIDYYDKSEGLKLEKLYIVKYRLKGFKLLNSVKIPVNKKQQEELTNFLLNKREFNQILDYKPQQTLPNIKQKHPFVISEEIQKKVQRNHCANIFTIYSLNYREIYYALKGKICKKDVFLAINDFYSKINQTNN